MKNYLRTLAFIFIIVFIVFLLRVLFAVFSGNNIDSYSCPPNPRDTMEVKYCEEFKDIGIDYINP